VWLAEIGATPLWTYASVSEEPEKASSPNGRAWAEDLGYPEELAKVPDAAAESFACVANPWALGRLAPGERVLDLGSGAGTDSRRSRRHPTQASTDACIGSAQFH
jgi:hypothetical protein